MSFFSKSAHWLLECQLIPFISPPHQLHPSQTGAATNRPVNPDLSFWHRLALSLGGRFPRRVDKRPSVSQTRARGDPVSSGGRRRPRAHCVVDLICVLLPQGRQGPERSDIGLGAPAGLI